MDIATSALIAKQMPASELTNGLKIILDGEQFDVETASRFSETQVYLELSSGSDLSPRLVDANLEVEVIEVA